MTSSAYPNFKTHFAELFHQAGNHITTLDASIRIELARTKQASHGDYSCNLAMQLAKPLHKIRGDRRFIDRCAAALALSGKS